MKPRLVTALLAIGCEAELLAIISIAILIYVAG